jgi:hypothetical protein
VLKFASPPQGTDEISAILAKRATERRPSVDRFDTALLNGPLQGIHPVGPGSPPIATQLWSISHVWQSAAVEQCALRWKRSPGLLMALLRQRRPSLGRRFGISTRKP